MVNLSIEIMLHLAYHPRSGRPGEGVSMSNFRKEWQIPASTFHRHMNTLIARGIVKRVKRDKYKLSLGFTGRCRNIYNDELRQSYE